MAHYRPNALLSYLFLIAFAAGNTNAAANKGSISIMVPASAPGQTPQTLSVDISKIATIGRLSVGRQGQNSVITAPFYYAANFTLRDSSGLPGTPGPVLLDQYKKPAQAIIFCGLEYQDGQWTDISGIGFPPEGFRALDFTPTKTQGYSVTSYPKPGPVERITALKTWPTSATTIYGQPAINQQDYPRARPVSDFEEEILRNPELFFNKDGTFKDHLLVVTAKKNDQPFPPLAPNTGALWGENTLPHLTDAAGTMPTFSADVPMEKENAQQTQQYSAPIDKIYQIWSPKNNTAPITKRFIAIYPSADNPKKPVSFIASTIHIKLSTEYLEAPGNNQQSPLYIAADVNREGKKLVATGAYLDATKSKIYSPGTPFFECVPENPENIFADPASITFPKKPEEAESLRKEWIALLSSREPDLESKAAKLLKVYTSIQNAYTPSCFAKAISAGLWKGQLAPYHDYPLNKTSLEAQEMKNEPLSPLFLLYVAQKSNNAAILLNGPDAAAKKKWQNPNNIGAALQIKAYSQDITEPFTGVMFFAPQAGNATIPYPQPEDPDSLFTCWYEGTPNRISQIPPQLAGSAITRIEIASPDDVKKLAEKKELLQKFLDQGNAFWKLTTPPDNSALNKEKKKTRDWQIGLGTGMGAVGLLGLAAAAYQAKNN